MLLVFLIVIYKERKWYILFSRDLFNEKEVLGLGKDDCLVLLCIGIFALNSVFEIHFVSIAHDDLIS